MTDPFAFERLPAEFLVEARCASPSRNRKKRLDRSCVRRFLGSRKLLNIHANVAREGGLVYKKGGGRADGWVNVGRVRLPWSYPRPNGSAA